MEMFEKTVGADLSPRQQECRRNGDTTPGGAG